MTDRVGFIGVGAQGGPMARRLAESGIPTTLWARRPEVLEAFVDCGAEFATTPAELAATSDVVCLCVMNDRDVEEVASKVLPAMSAGGVVVVHSTVHPETCTDLAARAGPLGIAVVDAPVSGGGPAAAEGRLEVMVGADEISFHRCRPIFATFGEHIILVGPVGSGQMVKLVNNVLFMAHVALAEDAFGLAASMGIGRADLADVLARASGNSYAVGVMAVLGSMKAFAEVGATALRKDVAIVEGIVEAKGLPSGRILDVANDGLVRCNDEVRAQES